MSFLLLEMSPAFPKIMHSETRESQGLGVDPRCRHIRQVNKHKNNPLFMEMQKVLKQKTPKAPKIKERRI